MSERASNQRRLMSGLLIAGVMAAAFFAACDTKSPVGPDSITPPPSTTTSTVAPGQTGQPPPAPPALTASFVFSPAVAAVGQEVKVNGSGSTAAPGRSVVAFDWNFGDGVTKSGLTSSHDYGTAGTFPIALTVTDDAGQKATTTQTVTVVPPGATTTTTPPTVQVVHYVANSPVPDVPADLTLLFQLLTSGSSFLSRLSLIKPMADPEYGVSGSYVMGNGTTTGDIKGKFTGTITSIPNGQFAGSLTARVPGCTAERQFQGTVGQQLNWTGGTTLQDCAGSPLGFGSFSLNQTNTPPSTSTSTTTVPVETPPSTTTTSSSTSTIPPTTTTTSSSTSTVPPTTTTTSSSTTTIAPTTTTTSSSTTTIAPTTTTTSSSTSTSSTTSSTTTTIPLLSDLNPVNPTGGLFCRLSGTPLQLTVRVQNLAKGSAGPFDMNVAFAVGSGIIVGASSAGVPPGSFVDLNVAVPSGCFAPDCSFSISVDVGNRVNETNEENNTANGRCIG